MVAGRARLGAFVAVAICFALTGVPAAAVTDVTTPTVAPAATPPELAAVAASLRSDPVFVDPNAELALSAKTARILRRHIRASGTPVFVAVLPESTLAWTDGVANRMPGAVRRAVGLSGTYAVVAGRKFRAASDAVPGAAAMATGAFQARRASGVGAVLNEFVDRLARAAQPQTAPQSDATEAPRFVDHSVDEPVTQPNDGGGAGAAFGFVVIGGLVLAALGAAFGRSRRGGGWTRTPGGAATGFGAGTLFGSRFGARNRTFEDPSPPHGWFDAGAHDGGGSSPWHDPGGGDFGGGGSGGGGGGGGTDFGGGSGAGDSGGSVGGGDF